MLVEWKIISSVEERVLSRKIIEVEENNWSVEEMPENTGNAGNTGNA